MPAAKRRADKEEVGATQHANAKARALAETLPRLILESQRRRVGAVGPDPQLPGREQQLPAACRVTIVSPGARQVIGGEGFDGAAHSTHARLADTNPRSASMPCKRACTAGIARTAADAGSQNSDIVEVSPPIAHSL